MVIIAPEPASCGPGRSVGFCHAMPGKKNARPPSKRKRAGQVNKRKRGAPVPEGDNPRRCKARLKGDPTQRCSRWAAPGKEYCTSHAPPDRTTHGLASQYRVGLFEDLIAKFDDVPLDSVKDLTAELVLLRGLLAGLVETVKGGGSEDERTQALHTGADTIKGMVETIGKTAERMERIEHGLKINLNARQVAALAHQVVQIINQEVADPVVRQRISERIANLVVIA